MPVEPEKFTSDFQDAIFSLREDPHLVSSDERLKHLHGLKLTLEETLKDLGNAEMTLEKRMVPLTLEDMKLLEPLVFQRGKVIKEAFWATMKDNNVWSKIYASRDQAYQGWKISLLSTNIGDKEHFLISIETNSSYTGKSEPLLNIGVVSKVELEVLVENLEEYDELLDDF